MRNCVLDAVLVSVYAEPCRAVCCAMLCRLTWVLPLLQSVYEDVARDTNRGHTVGAVKECFCQAKDAGFKVGVLPGR